MIKARFLDEIIKKCVNNNGCLEWTGPMYKRKSHPTWKYPQIYFEKKAYRGNRLVLFLTTGILPKDKMSLHKCDNSICLNPDHLYWGTSFDNVRDTYIRKRAYNAKITHCPHGHIYQGINLRVDKNGHRTCRSCAWYKSRKMKVRPEIVKELGEYSKRIFKRDMKNG
jgi:hypothetical protein